MKKVSALILTIVLLLLLSLCSCDKPSLLSDEKGSTDKKEVVEHNEIAWKECTVSVVNFLIGTEIYVLRSDGSASIYYTSDICSASAFINDECPTVSLFSDIESSPERIDVFNEAITLIYSNGTLLPVENEYEDQSKIDGEPRLVFVTVDGSEEVQFVKNYSAENDSPLYKYRPLMTILHDLFPTSTVLGLRQ